jgi:hypothetical protein
MAADTIRGMNMNVDMAIKIDDLQQLAAELTPEQMQEVAAGIVVGEDCWADYVHFCWGPEECVLKICYFQDCDENGCSEWYPEVVAQSCEYTTYCAGY